MPLINIIVKLIFVFLLKTRRGFIKEHLNSLFRNTLGYKRSLHGSDMPCEALYHWPAMQAFSRPSMLNQTVITNKSKSVQAPEGESAKTRP